MKHVWTMETVNYGRSAREANEWMRAKKAELERKTRVAWSFEPAHGKVIFWPYMRAEDAQWCDLDVSDRIFEYLRGKKTWEYTSLLDISEAINVPLPEVCGTCWQLVKAGELKATVDRMGKPHAVALVR